MVYVYHCQYDDENDTQFCLDFLGFFFIIVLKIVLEILLKTNIKAKTDTKEYWVLAASLALFQS